MINSELSNIFHDLKGPKVKYNLHYRNPSRRFGDIRELLKSEFLPLNAYFSNNKIFSSFIEYTLLWGVSAKLFLICRFTNESIDKNLE